MPIRERARMRMLRALNGVPKATFDAEVARLSKLPDWVHDLETERDDLRRIVHHHLSLSRWPALWVASDDQGKPIPPPMYNEVSWWDPLTAELRPGEVLSAVVFRRVDGPTSPAVEAAMSVLCGAVLSFGTVTREFSTTIKCGDPRYQGQFDLAVHVFITREAPHAA